MRRQLSRILFVSSFMFYCNSLYGQFTVIKMDGIGILTQMFKPSVERTFHNFSMLLNYENGNYAAESNSSGYNIYKLRGWGIVPEIRYYPFHKNNVSPFGFFFGGYYTYRQLSERYHEKGLDISTKGKSWVLGLSAGYKNSLYDKRICLEILVGAGLPGGSFEQPNQRALMNASFEGVDLRDLNNSLRGEISIGFVFPKQKVAPKKISNPPMLADVDPTLSKKEDSDNSISTIILYDPAKTLGSDYTYSVHIDDSLVYEAEWGTSDTIKVKASKELNIWATTGEKESISFTPEKGKTYFIRCDIKNVGLLNTPSLKFIDPETALKELNKIRKN